MIKKILYILCFFSIYSSSNAFFGEPSDLNLYKNIDSGIGQLEENLISIELDGGDKKIGIIKGINEIATLEGEYSCLDESKEITRKDFEDIVKNENLSKMYKYIDLSCVNKADKNSVYTIDLIDNYLFLFKEYYKESRKTALKKSKQMYKISNIGLYSDGILENSGFDLIKDIEEIDKIIFADVIYYEGENNVNLGDIIMDSFEDVEDKMNAIKYGKYSYNPEGFNPNKKLEDITNYRPINNDIDLVKNTLTYNQYICSESQKNSGLNIEHLNFLFKDTQNNIFTNNIDGKLLTGNTEINSNSKLDNSIIDLKNPSNTTLGISNTVENSGYEKVRDNSIWPCTKFFCINIDFVTYEHNLFGGGENITIEYLLNRSNQHFKKFASTSLVPAKMSTNLFEIGLKDLNLPDIFHMSFQVSTKPVPILRIESEGKQDNSEFASTNMLEKYYKANGLNYKRRNDLNIFKNADQSKQIIINSENLTNINALTKQENFYKNHIEKDKEKIKTLNKSVEKKVSYGLLEDFENQYIEIDKFTVAIYDYIENINSIIKKMREIPIDKG